MNITHELATDTGIEFFDGTPVRVSGQSALRGSVGSSVKGVDRLRKAELRRRHGYARGEVVSQACVASGSRVRLASAPRIASR